MCKEVHAGYGPEEGDTQEPRYIMRTHHEHMRRVLLQNVRAMLEYGIHIIMMTVCTIYETVGSLWRF
jgi:hypothetical protein